MGCPWDIQWDIHDQTLDPPSWIPDHGSWIQDPGSRILDPGSRILNLGSRILDPGSWAKDPGSPILGPRSRILDIDARTLEPRSWMLDPGSASCGAYCIYAPMWAYRVFAVRLIRPGGHITLSSHALHAHLQSCSMNPGFFLHSPAFAHALHSSCLLSQPGGAFGGGGAVHRNGLACIHFVAVHFVPPSTAQPPYLSGIGVATLQSRPRLVTNPRRSAPEVMATERL